MGLNRYAKKRDSNEKEIVKALRAAGAGVWPLDRPADLLVGVPGRLATFEVKDGAKPPSARKLTPGEETYASAAAALGLPHYVVTDVQGALKALAEVRR